MDLFKNEVNDKKFKSTNDLWNKLGLNTSWSVGYVSNIIKSKFKSKEEWKEYYFKSGIERQNRLKKLPISEQNALNSLTINNYHGKNAHLNYNFGRTRNEIAQKGLILYEHIVKAGNPLQLTETECMLIAYFRVVCETWNGIAVREYNTRDYIEKYFKDRGRMISLIDTSGRFDCSFGVDFEVYHEGNIECGLQIKPPSYNGDKEYLKTAKIMNNDKNTKYKEQFNREVLYVYSEVSGEICNKEILKSLDNILSQKNKI